MPAERLFILTRTNSGDLRWDARRIPNSQRDQSGRDRLNWCSIGHDSSKGLFLFISLACALSVRSCFSAYKRPARAYHIYGLTRQIDSPDGFSYPD